MLTPESITIEAIMATWQTHIFNIISIERIELLDRHTNED